MFHVQLHTSYSEKELNLSMRTRILKELQKLLADYRNQVIPIGNHRLNSDLLDLGIQSVVLVHFGLRVSFNYVYYVQRVATWRAILEMDSLMAVYLHLFSGLISLTISNA